MIWAARFVLGVAFTVVVPACGRLDRDVIVETDHAISTDGGAPSDAGGGPSADDAGAAARPVGKGKGCNRDGGCTGGYDVYCVRFECSPSCLAACNNNYAAGSPVPSKMKSRRRQVTSRSAP